MHNNQLEPSGKTLALLSGPQPEQNIMHTDFDLLPLGSSLSLYLFHSVSLLPIAMHLNEHWQKLGKVQAGRGGIRPACLALLTS